MEVNNPERAENRLTTSLASVEASLEIIRTETVLSRLPVHNLAKTGRVNIQIIKTTPTGEVELKWEVSYSDRYGQARQLAYKLDTIIINQRIEEAGRPLPKLLRIGSLNDICTELNVAAHAGQNAKDLKRAFLQNASAFINAKFSYRANDGTERHVEAGITRYGVIFTGEKLPDGRRADAVYVAFNDPFWEVLNNAPVRPLDRAYMKSLPPAAQRFYEIISRKIFAALKNNYPRAKISYSEYCTFSAQLRHFERQPVQNQMAKVIRHHKKSGYITAVKYEPTIDAQNQPDWIMYLTPGPRAFAEFAAVHGKRKVSKTIEGDAIEKGDHQPSVRRTGPRQQRSTLSPAPEQPRFDPQLVAEFMRRGITEEKTMQLLASRRPGQDVIAQLEITDQLILRAGFKIVNPPGFYIRQIERNMPIPESFETSARRKVREEAEQKERARRDAEEARELLELDYDRYCAAETERFIAEHPDLFEPVKDAKIREENRWSSSLSLDLSNAMAIRSAKWEMRKQVPLLTLEEFANRGKEGTDFSSLKPVALPPDAVATSEPTPEAKTVSDSIAAATELPTTHERGDAIQTAPEPAMPEPAILLVAELPHQEPDENLATPGLV